MKTYKAIFICDSRMNKLPDAQTIFGALCFVYASVFGDSARDEYLESFHTKPILLHSSMFPNHLYPMIKQNLIPIDFVNQYVLQNEPEKQLELLSQLKKYKKIQWMSEKVYKKYISTARVEQLKKELLSHTNRFNIKDNKILSLNNEKVSISSAEFISTRIKRKTGSEIMDSELFYDRDIFYPKGQEFVIYFKTELPMDKLENLLIGLSYFPIGNRGSTGKNNFCFKTIEKIDVSTSANTKLLLSKCIPQKDEFDYEKSSYSIYSAYYHSSKFYGNQYVGTFSKIVEGSWLAVKENKEYYGHVIMTKVNDKPLYHYGIGFVL